MPTTITAIRTFRVPKSLNESLRTLDQSLPAPDGNRSMEGAKEVNDGYSKAQKNPLASNQPKHEQGITFAAQEKLPKLPIPELGSTMTKYLAALKPLQTPREHAETKQAVEDFLRNDGPELHDRLKKYATGKTSYIEQFCTLTSFKSS